MNFNSLAVSFLLSVALFVRPVGSQGGVQSCTGQICVASSPHAEPADWSITTVDTNGKGEKPSAPCKHCELDGLPVNVLRPSVDTRINVRGLLPAGRGRFGDGIIGGQALEQGIPLVTDDTHLAAAVRALGGTVR